MADLRTLKNAGLEFASQRWVTAVNEHGQHGTWRYEMARSVGAIREILDAS